MMIEAFKALQQDDATRVLVLINKPPADEVVRLILDQVTASAKPTVICFLGGEASALADIPNVIPACTLYECALLAAKQVQPKIGDVRTCVSILLYDPRSQACGAVHAGWRGTADGILIRTIDTMASAFKTASSDLLVAIGPSIRRCCYEVGEEVIKSVSRRSGTGDFVLREEGRASLDLPLANRQQALNRGVNPKNIWVSTECTRCAPGRFYSSRFSDRVMGKQGGFIGIFS